MGATRESYPNSTNAPVGPSNMMNHTLDISHPDGGVLEEYAWMMLGEYWENVKSQYTDIDLHVAECEICALQVADSQNALEESDSERPMDNLESVSVDHREVVKRLIRQAFDGD